MACALLSSSLLAQAVYKPTEKPNETISSNDIITFELTRSSDCNDSSGVSGEFEVYGTTTTRFYIENNADFDITIKLQKRLQYERKNFRDRQGKLTQAD